MENFNIEILLAGLDIIVTNFYSGRELSKVTYNNSYQIFAVDLVSLPRYF
jgi:hypothetical protein